MQPEITTSQDQPSSWLDRPLGSTFKLNWEILLFGLIIVLAIFTRFYILGTRVISHDETSHVYFSWLLYRGNGYQHDPITHGPFQFHVIALSYFLLGDNDFSARLPAALFSIAAVIFAWKLRQYVGRAGGLVTALLLAISPYMMYYGRYARNEAFVAFFGIVMLWAMLVYLETGAKRYLYIFTLMVVLHFTAKETSYIYAAQALLFLVFYLVYRITQQPWKKTEAQVPFITSIILGLVLLGVTAGLKYFDNKAIPGTTQPAPVITGPQVSQAVLHVPPYLFIVFIILAVLAFAAAIAFAIYGYTLPRIRRERSFDLLMLLGTLMLPLLTAFPLSWLHWNVPTNLTTLQAMTPQSIIQMAAVFVVVSLVTIALGLWWSPRLWLGNAALFYGIFTVLYTTFFTNGGGFFTGLLGSLAYWLEQQGVNRGSQPWYYYGLVQVPMYEYLPALGTVLAVVLVVVRKLTSTLTLKAQNGAMAVVTQDTSPLNPPDVPLQTDAVDNDNPVDYQTQTEFDQAIGVEADLSLNEVSEYRGSTELDRELPETPPVVALFLFWAVTSLLAYSIAGEKMPWLTVHITLPLILTSGWLIGQLVERMDWSKFRIPQGWLIVALLPVFFTSLAGSVGSLLGPNPPFQGKSLDQLQASSTFMTAFLGVIASGWGLFMLLRRWNTIQILRTFVMACLCVLGIFTLRSSVLTNFYYYDNATELLVYAHCGPGIKVALAQIEELSRRTTGSLAMPVAYDNDTTYPYWWYLRNYTDQRYYGANPTRDLRQVPAILVGAENYGKIEPVVGQAYYKFEYIRMWWPNQDYFNLSWERIREAFVNPQMRSAIFQIWLNHDYQAYAKAINRDMSLPKWDPAERMSLYLRKDLVSQLWNYGTTSAAEMTPADPYEGKEIKLQADKIFGSLGIEPGQFTMPCAMAFAPDGSIYVADSGNHRIQHLSAEGTVLKVWGIFGKTEGSTVAAPGAFNEPWGIAVGNDGSVYVSDTWNHRIQKFTAEGEFLKEWGTFGTAETPFALWGPRGIVIDPETGNVFVADTGNKRIVVYDADGNSVSEFGGSGYSPGQFNEPVGLALDKMGNLFVTDTWNQRVQVLKKDENGRYTSVTDWEIVGWYGQSLDNKPYLAVDDQRHVFVTDPEGYRVLEFTAEGQFLRYWGDYGPGPDRFGMPIGIVADPISGIWVVDSANARLMHFTLPVR